MFTYESVGKVCETLSFILKHLKLYERLYNGACVLFFNDVQSVQVSLDSIFLINEIVKISFFPLFSDDFQLHAWQK